MWGECPVCDGYESCSGRPWDLEDLPAVLAESGFESLDAALEWVERAHSGRQIPVSAKFYLKNAWDAVAAVSQRRPPAAGPAYLWVRPSAGSDGAGWDIELRPPGRESLSGGVRYPSIDAALQASGFAQTLLNMAEPLRFEEWEQGWELREPMPGHWGVRVLPVPRVGGWALYAFGPAGDQRAVSSLYPTQRSAASAQRFLQYAQATLAAKDGDDRVHLRCVAVCACRDQGLRCRHHTDTYPAVNQVSVSIRPRPDATQDWEVVVHEDDGDPIRVSSPFPTEAAAAGTRNFVLAVANATHPIHFEGWKPWLRGGPGYRPPPPDQAATTVRIKPPSSPKSDGVRTGSWRPRRCPTRATRQPPKPSTLPESYPCWPGTRPAQAGYGTPPPAAPTGPAPATQRERTVSTTKTRTPTTDAQTDATEDPTSGSDSQPARSPPES